MKYNFLLPLAFFAIFFIACEEDDHDECQECSVLCALDDGTTHEHEIGEFCGDDLHDIEANGYTLPSEMTIKGVTYEAGHVFAPNELCCEAHGHEDDHDH